MRGELRGIDAAVAEIKLLDVSEEERAARLTEARAPLHREARFQISFARRFHSPPTRVWSVRLYSLRLRRRTQRILAPSAFY
jgi:hypothetical protein